MRQKQIDDLIQRELDGVLSPQEASLLESLAATDARVAALRRALQAVPQNLAGLSPQEVPPTLKPSIMRALEARLPVRARNRLSLSTLLGARLDSLRPRRAFVGGLVVGLVSAMIAVVAIVPLPLRDTDAAGTAMVLEAVPTMRQSANVHLAGEGISGSLSMETAGQFQMATLILAATGTEYSALLTYPEEQVQLAAVRPEGVGSVPVSAGNGRVELQLQGQTRLELLFRVSQGASTPLRLRVRNPQGVEHEAAVAFAPPAPR